MKRRLILALLLASCLLLPILTTAQNKQTCTCTCLGQDSGAAVLKSGDNAEPKCQQQCARTCGGFTDCPTASDSKCSDCCDTYCNGNDATKGYSGDYPEDCKTSCKSACDFRKLVNGIRDIIYAAAGIVGALMLIIHGIRLAVSKDPRGRDDAKSSMWHVIIALIIIALAASLVDLFINIGLKPAPALPGEAGGNGGAGTGGLRTDPDGKGEITDATAEVVNGQLKINVKFENKGDAAGKYAVDLYDKTGIFLTGGMLNKEVIGREYVEVEPGKTGEISGEKAYPAIFSDASSDDKTKVGIQLVRYSPVERGDVKRDYKVVGITGAETIAAGTIELVTPTQQDYCFMQNTRMGIGDDTQIRITLKFKNNGDDKVQINSISILDYNDNQIAYYLDSRTIEAQGEYTLVDQATGRPPPWKYGSFKTEINGQTIYAFKVKISYSANPETFGPYTMPKEDDIKYPCPT